MTGHECSTAATAGGSRERVRQPVSCDTFVVLPPLTEHGGVIFGKNSDRPRGEVQELVYFPAADHPAGSKLQCTYLEIDQVEHTQAVVLSKPAWMWGAEMGANEAGVVVGNEAVYTLVDDGGEEERLLGMDLVRLALERSTTAEGAVEVVTQLLERHGQGGPCSDSDPGFTYHNSFLLADATQAWVLETAGRHWAAKSFTSGFRNISNALSLSDDYDRCSEGLADVAASLGRWEGSGRPPFAEAFGSKPGDGRYRRGREQLERLSEGGKFGIKSMFEVLRDVEGGICRPVSCAFPTQGSQVSVLSPPGSGKPHCHWFTATPDPRHSVFKPFIFTPAVRISRLTVSPTFDPDPAKVVPRFQTPVDREHTLYRLHAAVTAEASGGSECPPVLKLLRQMEDDCVAEVEAFVDGFSRGEGDLSEVDDLLKDCVETEVKFYK